MTWQVGLIFLRASEEKISMAKQLKRYTPKFKFQVVLEAVRSHQECHRRL